jgi:anti-anti-sigma factor
MKIEYSNTASGDIIVKLHGEMDALGCTHIRPELEEITNSDDINNVILDLGQVSFLDSSGVGVIVFLFKRLKTNGRKLEIIEAHDQPQELMELLRIDTVIPVRVSSFSHSLSE